MVRDRYRVADSAQQVVGGFLLAGPFVVTEEVWAIAQHMAGLHTAIVTLIIVLIGYGALYRADTGRDVDDEEKEPSVLGVPVRFISLLVVAYGAVALLVFLLRAPTTFDATLWTTVKAISVSTVFSIIGAATADSLF